MKRLAFAFVLVVSVAVPVLLAQQAQTQVLPGRYFTSSILYGVLKNGNAKVGNSLVTAREAQFYLMGVYDLSQQTGQSCATRGTTNPAQLEQAYTSYIDAHGVPRDTLATHAQLQTETAAGTAAQAFKEAWPCQN